MQITGSRHSASSSVHISVALKGWVIVADRNHGNQTFPAAYKVDSVDCSFDLNEDSLKYMPGRVSFQGKWASKDGKKWLDRQTWFGWNNQKLQKFAYLPHEVQNEVFKTLCDYIGAQAEHLTKQVQTLRAKGRFATHGYVEPLPTEDGSAPAFLPSVAEVEASPFIGQDLTNWKVACEEAGIPWTSKRRGRKGKP